MTKVKIKVLKTFSNKDVLGENVPPDWKEAASVCNIHRPGQEYFFDGTGCPEGLCAWAFADIFRDILHLWRGGDFPWVGKAGVMYSACVDGKRPVVFRLERIED
jgi:uncharacterized repeat protein (TIGR04076 family)